MQRQEEEGRGKKLRLLPLRTEKNYVAVSFDYSNWIPPLCLVILLYHLLLYYAYLFNVYNETVKPSLYR
jgi:hypothetical protein